MNKLPIEFSNKKNRKQIINKEDKEIKKNPKHNIKIIYRMSSPKNEKRKLRNKSNNLKNISAKKIIPKFRRIMLYNSLKKMREENLEIIVEDKEIKKSNLKSNLKTSTGSKKTNKIENNLILRKNTINTEDLINQLKIYDQSSQILSVTTINNLSLNSYNTKKSKKKLLNETNSRKDFKTYIPIKKKLNFFLEPNPSVDSLEEKIAEKKNLFLLDKNTNSEKKIFLSKSSKTYKNFKSNSKLNKFLSKNKNLSPIPSKFYEKNDFYHKNIFQDNSSSFCSNSDSQSSGKFLDIDPCFNMQKNIHLKILNENNIGFENNENIFDEKDSYSEINSLSEKTLILKINKNFDKKEDKEKEYDIISDDSSVLNDIENNGSYFDIKINENLES